MAVLFRPVQRSLKLFSKHSAALGIRVDPQKRNIRRELACALRELKRRQKEEEKKLNKTIIHRSAFSNWNYKAELFAFGKRLKEEFNEDDLRTALIHNSYIEQEETKRKELGISADDKHLQLKDNSDLIKEGEMLLSDYVKGYLRVGFPFFPEEGIVSVHDYLTSTETLYHIAFNLGTKDLILSSDYPPNKLTYANTFKAILGALQRNNDEQRVENFIQDFVLTQLVGKDINEMWQIANPMGMLSKILLCEGKEVPESRLLRESGRNTILSTYVVGVYSNKEFLGTGYGETVLIAEEMAARDALKRMFQTTGSESPLPFGDDGHNMKVKIQPNLSIDMWASKHMNKLKL